MEFATGFAVYFLFWWLTLFAILPYNLRSQKEDGVVVPGTDAGAPTNLNIWKKLLINSLVSGVLFTIYWIATQKFGFGLDNIPSLFPKN